jgi:hypothetical protein
LPYSSVTPLPGSEHFGVVHILTAQSGTNQQLVLPQM